MEGQVAQLRRLYPKILERLRVWVDLLVNELPLHLVGRHGVPPEQFVEVVCSRLQEDLGDIEVTATLDDLAINQLGNLRHGIVLRAVQLESLTSCSIVVQHLLKRGADVDDLESQHVKSYRQADTYVNWPETLLHVVGGEEIRHAGKLVQEIVFEAEHGSRSHNRGFGVNLASHFLSPALLLSAQ